MKPFSYCTCFAALALTLLLPVAHGQTKAVAPATAEISAATAVVPATTTTAATPEKPAAPAAAVRAATPEAKAPPAQPGRPAAKVPPPPPVEWRNPKIPGLVETEWLAQNLSRSDVRVIDCRPATEYTQAHIAGSLSLSSESLRGTIGGVPEMLLPREMLAAQFSLLGLVPTHTVIIVPGEELRDATLIAMALERLGHVRFAVLNGGFGRWSAETRPTTASLLRVVASRYPVPSTPDPFTVDAFRVLRASTAGNTTILDVRSEEYYRGDKSEEARAGHIPNAKNRPVKRDLIDTYGFPQFRPASELAPLYKELIPDPNSSVIVQCRTGREASQTYFLLKYLLGYRNVEWYDGGWTEWAARSDLPVQK